MNLTDDKKFEFSNEFTISMWVDQDGASSYVGSGPSGSSSLFNREGEYYIGITKSGELIYTISTTSHDWGWIKTDAVLDSSKWSHLVVTFGNDSLKFYVDGIQKSAHSLAGDINEVSSQNEFLDELRIGGRQDLAAAKQVFNGKLDDVKLFSKELNIESISTLYDYENIDFKSNKIAEYDFNFNVEDQVNSLDGELVGGEYTTDRFGNLSEAISLDGVDDYIQLTDVKAFEFSNEFTISMWVDQDGASSYVGSGPSGSSSLFNREGEYYVGITKSGELIYTVSTTTHDWGWIKTDAVLDSSKWSHLVVTFDNDSLKFYVDGLQESAHSLAGDINEVSSQNESLDELRIGGRQDLAAAKQVFNGKLDDVSIYSTGLSSSEVLEIYNEDKVLSLFGVKNIDKLLTVYPNPVYDELIIDALEVSSGVVTSLDGVEVMKVVSNQVDVSQLERGIYILKVEGAQKGTLSTKFIKN